MKWNLWHFLLLEKRETSMPIGAIASPLAYLFTSVNLHFVGTRRSAERTTSRIAKMWRTADGGDVERLMIFLKQTYGFLHSS